MNALERFLKREQGGQAIVLIALLLLTLLMFSGLAVDAGQLYSARRTMQEAADSAAYAGAVVVYQGGTKSSGGACGTITNTGAQVYLAAVADATKNGFTNGVGGNTVTIHNPPTSGSRCGDNRYVEVSISTNVRTSLVPAESGLSGVSVHAVAGAEPLNNGFALMALDPGNDPSAFYVDSQADIHITGGGILVNSTSSTALVNGQTNGCRFTVGAPYEVDIAGNTGSAFYGCSSPVTPPPPVEDGQPQVSDPFAAYPKPSTTGMIYCDNTNYATLPCTALYDSGTSTRTLNPGIYNYPIGAMGSTTIVLNSGIYILEQGINAAGNADIVTQPGGVLLFNTKTNYPNSTSTDTCSALTLGGNANTTMQAMTTGTYANLLIFQDPICTVAMSIAGSGNATFNAAGTIYLPTAQFAANGNNVTLTGSQVVAKTIFINGGNLNIDFNAGNTAQPILPRLIQ